MIGPVDQGLSPAAVRVLAELGMISKSTGRIQGTAVAAQEPSAALVVIPEPSSHYPDRAVTPRGSLGAVLFRRVLQSGFIIVSVLVISSIGWSLLPVFQTSGMGSFLQFIGDRSESQDAQPTALGRARNEALKNLPEIGQAAEVYLEFVSILRTSDLRVSRASVFVSQDPQHLLKPTGPTPPAEWLVSPIVQGVTVYADPLSAMRGVPAGLAFIHVDLVLEGSFVGYGRARKFLFGRLPSAVVHAEHVLMVPGSSGDIQTRLTLTIPALKL